MGKPAVAIVVSACCIALSTPATAAASPDGQPVGTATMQVTGSGQATVRYQINGGAEQTQSNVTLPWSMQYPVYDEIASTVTADGGDQSLVCTITMDGNLLAFKSEPRPTCSFAYYG
jgi:hypothetical protein